MGTVDGDQLSRSLMFTDFHPWGSYNPEANRDSNGLSLNVKMQIYSCLQRMQIIHEIISPHCKCTHGPNVIICVCAYLYKHVFRSLFPKLISATNSWVVKTNLLQIA